MSLYAVANIVDQLDNIVYVRILDTTSHTVKDIPYKVLISVLTQNKDAVYNVEVVNGSLTGKGSSLKSFPLIKNNSLVGQAPATVIYKAESTYTIANYKGITVNVSEEKLIEYAKIHGLTNGKLVNKGDKIIVSSKQGSFEGDIKEQTVSKEQDTQKVDNINNENNESSNKNNENSNKNNKIVHNNINESLDTFNLDNIQVLGIHMLLGEFEIEQARRSHEVLLIKSNNILTYLPNMVLGDIRKTSDKILVAIANYIGRSISNSELGKDIVSLLVENNRNITYSVVPSQINFAIHDIRTLINKNQYKIGFVTVQKELKLGMFNGNQFISDELCYIDNRNLTVAFRNGDNFGIVDITNNNVYQIDKVARISEITSKYVVSLYDGQLIVKGFNNRAVYRENEVYEYELLGDRFLVVNSYSNKILDLETHQILECKFANTCDNFIYKITNDTFVDRYGEHSINELPNLTWTGYTTEEFISKYSGFIPNPREIGVKGIRNLGRYKRITYDYFMVRGLTEGIFSLNNNQLENILTHEVVTVDQITLQWALTNPRIGIIKNNSRSILALLREGKTLFKFSIKDEKLKYKGFDFQVDNKEVFISQVQDIKILDDYNIEIIIKDKETGFRSLKVENK